MRRVNKERSAFRSTKFLGTKIYVNTWYKYTPGIVTWVTIGHNTLGNFGSFTEIVMPSSVYLDLCVMTSSLNWRVDKYNFTHGEAFGKRISAGLNKFNSSYQEKQTKLNMINAYGAKIEALSEKSELVGTESKKLALDVNKIKKRYKSTKFHFNQKQTYIKSINNAINNIAMDNSTISNNVSKTNTIMSTAVTRLNTNKLVVNDVQLVSHV
ncbi:hypothetical protein [uncultured Shewanella sp.]|uniref:hypothetical protein n=1 Tax=uncultured Shewanella sp. TaxID=173975 RepID=UPI00261B50F7|nr:hypothetical protein [uncultured Shewanella sp.]